MEGLLRGAAYVAFRASKASTMITQWSTCGKERPKGSKSKRTMRLTGRCPMFDFGCCQHGYTGLTAIKQWVSDFAFPLFESHFYLVNNERQFHDQFLIHKHSMLNESVSPCPPSMRTRQCYINRCPVRALIMKRE